MNVYDFVVYSGDRVSELLERVSNSDDVGSEISCVILELEEHQRILEEFIRRESDPALIAQADQYQTDLSKTIEAYKNLEKLLGGYQNERI
ncbi:hypothetical protein GF358_03570 [Candidatus Woesearchaeota archaeon]|nr:hypothetical protein [Candidatus Woesearchaeota archaeon]